VDQDAAGYDVGMSEPKDNSSLTETGTARSAPPPAPPVESQPDPDSTDEISDEERRGWPDEPTTS
jgi:hypothetical protein